ncbi:MAG: hypothetical protein AAF958_03210 [Planctomycetota bacterium]
MLTGTWLHSVAVYLDQLGDILSRVDESMERLRITTIEQGPRQIEPTLHRLAEALSDLERHVIRREELLRDDAAPKSGYNLLEKLADLGPDAERIHQAASDYSKQIESLRDRSLSQFVCQFHLADLTAGIVRTLCGDSDTPTYGKSNPNAKRPRNGGLFNEAA